MNGDAADRQGPLHAGGHWRDTARLSDEGSDTTPTSAAAISCVHVGLQLH